MSDIFGGIMTPDYETYLARHGESGVQDIIEKIERREGISPNREVPLEERWSAIMFRDPCQPRFAA